MRVSEGGPAGFFLQWEKIATPLYSDLFEQTFLDTGCRLFLMGGYHTEMDHLRVLILQLLPHGKKHLKKLLFVERKRGFSGLPSEWRHSSGMGVLRV